MTAVPAGSPRAPVERVQEDWVGAAVVASAGRLPSARPGVTVPAVRLRPVGADEEAAVVPASALLERLDAGPEALAVGGDPALAVSAAERAGLAAWVRGVAAGAP